LVLKNKNHLMSGFKMTDENKKQIEDKMKRYIEEACRPTYPSHIKEKK